MSTIQQQPSPRHPATPEAPTGGARSNDGRPAGKRHQLGAEQILNFAGEGLYAVDADGRVTFVNETAARLLGCEPAALLGRQAHELHRPSDDQRACPLCTPLQDGVGTRGSDASLVRPDGAAFPVDYTSTAPLHRGTVTGIVTFNDATERARSEAESREAELKYLALTESATDAILSADAAGLIVAWNRGAERMFGYTEEEVVGRPLTILMPERYRDMHEAGMARFLSTRDPKLIGSTVEVHALSSDGREFAVELSLAHWQRGEVHFFTGILRDITERKTAEAALAREVSFIQLLQQVSVAANEASDGQEALARSLRLICEHTGWPTGHVYWVEANSACPLVSKDIWYLQNPKRQQAFRDVTNDTQLRFGEGLPGRVLVSGRPSWIRDVTDDPNFPRAAAASAAGLRAAFAFPVLVGTETVAVLEFFTEEVLEADEALCVIMAQIGIQLGRVIERERGRDQLTHHAMHDPLTGLPNRSLVLDRITQALARARRGSSVAVLFLDLDRFKFINDSLGHEAGDALLKAATVRLRAVVRQGDTVARFGGDEFVVLCEDLEEGEQGAAGVAERLAEALAAPFELDGNEVFVTASVGIALSRGRETPAELLRNADAALYQAKDGGRARHEVFSDVMRAASVQRLRTVNELHRAIERNQLVLHYQPQILLETGALVGVEALVRWVHPERGLVPPLEFIPLAEETGLIGSLGRWVLNEACDQGRRWQAAYPSDTPLTISVNLSPKQLLQPGIVDEVRDALQRSGLEPTSLVLEITESVLVHDTETTVEQLRALKRLGVRLAIDDFGTGYSSLTYLRRFPIDVLKIDKSFIDGLGGNGEEAAVARTIVRLAQTLRLETVAEGVERGEHVRELQSLRCDLAQGYYYARPLVADQLEALLQHGDATVEPDEGRPECA